MKPQSYKFKLEKSHQVLNLVDFLSQELTQALGVTISKSKIRMLVFAGAVYVDGKRMQIANFPLNRSSQVMVYVDLNRLQKDRASQQKKIELDSSHIVYEDSEIIVVNKPAGLPTQATVDNSRDHLFAAVIRFLSQRENKEVYVGLHHRLDYDTSGLILFTKKKSANFWVSELFKNRKIRKIYHAITEKRRQSGETWEIKNHIARAKDKNGGRVIHMEEVHSGGDLAHTQFKILKDLPNQLQLVECRPLTGRTHQIRLHLKLSHQPILGDVLYGGNKSDRIYLHARELEFVHGGTHKQIKVECPYPNEMARLID